jgi:hypothetical protein
MSRKKTSEEEHHPRKRFEEDLNLVFDDPYLVQLIRKLEEAGEQKKSQKKH